MNILCPVCQKKLTRFEHCFKCENNHNYDIAKQGYVNLNMHSSQNTGDNPEMINARNAFLNKGYYDFLLHEINKYINKEDCLLDLACGQGYYTKRFNSNNKVGIELSKQGLKIASKNDPDSIYLLNSIFKNPIEEKSADKIITIFAPIAKQEILRILKDDGRFVLARPDEYHLYELKQVLYENPYLNEIEDIDIPGLKLDKEIRIKNKASLDKQDILNLFVMTPYYNTTSPFDKEKLNAIDHLDITFSFIVDIYRKDL